MPAAPQQIFVEAVGRLVAGEQRVGDGEADQRHREDHAGRRHRRRHRVDRRRRSPPKVQKQPQNRERHRHAHQRQPGVVERIDDHRHIVVEGRLAAVEQRRHEQQRQGEHHARHRRLAEPLEARPAPRGLLRRDQQQGAEDRQKPDDEGKHHVDHQPLVEETQGPGKHGLDAGNTGDRQEEGEHPGDRQGPHRQGRPAPQLPAKRRVDDDGFGGFGRAGFGRAGGPVRGGGPIHGHRALGGRGRDARPSRRPRSRRPPRTSTAARSSGRCVCGVRTVPSAPGKR